MRVLSSRLAPSYQARSVISKFSQGTTRMAEYTYQKIFQVDNSNGCYLEVTYGDLKGYVGVNLRPDATDETPYLFVTGQRGIDAVTDDGLGRPKWPRPVSPTRGNMQSTGLR